ncbi:Regulatory protein LuxO [Poriferisphaera corsica]|uniref:Regulatory protein LuxO n=1 Tax=Poriferisphaera corsica TaxID=2528020 RepID=A0A517YP84_9BACT|nr:sigma-54 dependent transcriptional regulator [Poriferisphaera corsica]QDU32029.1 Regulatory protein LuxO [Poriferisphaera corsica]
MSQTPIINVLLIDDDVQIHRLVRFMLRKIPVQLTCAYSFEQAQKAFPSNNPSANVVLLDYRLGDETSLDLIAPLHAANPDAPVILLTAHDTPDLIVNAMRSGAFDFLSKPIKEHILIQTISRAIEHYHLIETVKDPDHISAATHTNARYEGILGRSEQMQKLFHMISKVAPTDVAVLIHGESGTGKELIAHAIHNRSHRVPNPMIALNTAALPATLIESMLFGHEKGAFTGADRMRTGACEDADTGTLFLDEVTEMPLELQPKILRFAQEHKFNRLGSTVVHTADVRLISATNRHPLEEVLNHRFREDLYYRLSVIPIEVPPLRNRDGDIPLIAMHALYDYSEKYGKSFNEISSAALAAIEHYRWPGNVRELLNTIERVVVLNDATTLELDMLPHDILHPMEQPSVKSESNNSESLQSIKEHTDTFPSPTTPALPYNPDHAKKPEDIVPIAELERRAIEHAIQLCQGSPGKAAKHLEISEATIYRKIKSYGLRNPDQLS